MNPDQVSRLYKATEKDTVHRGENCIGAARNTEKMEHQISGLKYSTGIVCKCSVEVMAHGGGSYRRLSTRTRRSRSHPSQRTSPESNLLILPSDYVIHSLELNHSKGRETNLGRKQEEMVEV